MWGLELRYGPIIGAAMRRLLLRGSERMRGHRLWRRHGPMIGRMRHGMRQLDVHPSMARIIHPSLDCEQVDAVGAKHHVVDPLQSAGVRGDRQGHRRIFEFLRAMVRVMRELANALLDLRVQPMLRMRCLGQQRPALRIFQRGQCLLADNAVDVEMVGALEGFDGVEGVGAEGVIRHKKATAQTHITKVGKSDLQRSCFAAYGTNIIGKHITFGCPSRTLTLDDTAGRLGKSSTLDFDAIALKNRLLRRQFQEARLLSDCAL